MEENKNPNQTKVYISVLQEKLTFTRLNVKYLNDLLELKNEMVKERDYETASKMRACELLIYTDYLNLYLGKTSTSFVLADVKKFHYEVLPRIIARSHMEQFGTDFSDLSDADTLLKLLPKEFYTKEGSGSKAWEEEFLANFRSFYRAY